MVSPFYVTPASPMKGFQAFAESYTNRAEFERAKVKEKETQKLLEEGAALIAGDDRNAQIRFIALHPEVAPYFEKLINFKNAQTRRNLVDSSKKVMQASTPEEAVRILAKRGEFVLSQGGDIQGTLEAIKRIKEGPEGLQEIKEKAETTWSLLEAEEYTAYKKATATEAADAPTSTDYNDLVSMMGGKIPTKEQFLAYKNDVANKRLAFEERKFAASEKETKDEKVPPKVTTALNVIGKLSPQRSETQMLLEYFLGNAQTEGVNENDADEIRTDLSPAEQILFDRSIKILSDYFGIDESSQQVDSKNTIKHILTKEGQWVTP